MLLVAGALTHEVYSPGDAYPPLETRPWLGLGAMIYYPKEGRRGAVKTQGKHTPYFELVDAQAQAGCPICRLVYKACDRFLDAILYEATLDPKVRLELKHSHGFCPEHVEMMRAKPGRALGVALIYRDALRMLTEALDAAPRQPSSLRERLGARTKGRDVRALEPDQPCPACKIKESAAADYISLLLDHLDDETLYAAYAAGDGLCLPHLRQAVARVKEPETLRRLVEPQVERYKAMLIDLDEYIRKRDHRFRNEPMGPEGDVWLRVMNAITGGAGLGMSAKHGGRHSKDVGSGVGEL